MINLALIVNVLVNSLLLGGTYILIALGVNVIYGVLNVINFSHGQLLMLSMYFSYWLLKLFGLHPYMSVLLVAPAIFLLGMGIERIFIKPLYKAGHVSQILTTVGLGLILESVALILWTANYRSVNLPFIPASIAGIMISSYKLFAFVTALSISLIAYLLIKRTRFGMVMRAAAQNLDAAALCGVNVGRIMTLTFGLGCVFVSFAGVMLLPIYFVYPNFGDLFGLMAFVVVAIGGLGSFKGSIIGSIIIGLVQGVFTFVAPELGKAISLFVFILVLFFKSEGLFGERYV